jgi:vacuolar-type H+-ATPase subunit B/Vma2
MGIPIDTLAYARRLREAGFSEAQAEAQAEALAASMTDALATKQDLRELEARIDSRFTQVDLRFEYLERHIDTRLAEQERRVEIRFAEQTARFDGRLADLERRVTLRLGGITVAGIGVVSALVKLL